MRKLAGLGASMDMMRKRPNALVVLAAAAAGLAWVGWFSIAPVFGFPTIGPAAMVNRVFVPRSDPGAWVGWVALVGGLALVAVGYRMAVRRGLLPGGVLSGAAFGLVVGVVVGMTVMPIIGRISPPPPIPPAPPGPPLPTIPDPMHATFLMLHLGALAPVEALLAWLLFGSVLGSVRVKQPARGEGSDRRNSRGAMPVVAGAGLFVLALVLISGRSSAHVAAVRAGSADVGPQTRLLARGPAPELPPGDVFVSVIELDQTAGSTLGPHAHVPGFAYVLDGQETIRFHDGSTMTLGSRQGGFMGGLVVHAHENRQDLIPAGVVAGGLVLLVVLLSLVSLRWESRTRITALLLGLVIVSSALAVWNPWSNRWFFIGVRPEAARGSAMPLPDAARVYESPDLRDLPTGPYTEELRSITIPTGEQHSMSREPGAEMLLVLEGEADVRLDDGPALHLGHLEATLAQPGQSVLISNRADRPLRLLEFAVISASGDG